jgi:Zn-dependent M16 (insulinase) family peptidase
MYRAIILFMAVTALAQQPPVSYSNLSYSKLTEGQIVDGFRAMAVYLDDSGRAIGARFRHVRTGFTLDLLEIQSVPQAFFWVTTYPTSNMGEPHTQEHLLVGKGSKGRALGSREAMSLVTSNAFTLQWQTCYDFYDSAGPEVFYQSFESTLDALLHPDYTDEEIRREVRNFGVSADPRSGELRLEEKGSVYNEMSTSMDQAGSRLFHAAKTLVFGPEHPLAFNSGGTPEALRVLKPEDIRRFHAQHYFLANMGAIASLPKEMPPDDALVRLDAVLNRMEKTPPSIPVTTEDKLPAPQPAVPGRIQYVGYPFRNEQQPGLVALAWPPDRKLRYRDRTLLGLLMQTAAGGAGSNLYRRLVDSATRETDYGATNVFGFADDDPGNAIFVWLTDVGVAHMNDTELTALRAKVMDEFARIAAYADGSPELREFHERFRGRIVEQRRALAKLVNSPPGFGFRNGSAFWNSHLYQLNREPGFRKSLTMKDDLDAIDKLVSQGKNIWRDSLAQWKVLGVTPYVLAAKPSATLMAQEDKERQQRATAEAERLVKLYDAPDPQAAIARYRQEYDATTARLEKQAHDAAPPKFVDTPPMTLDDQLDFQTAELAGGVPLVMSRFESMTSATAGIALRLDGLAEDRLVFVSALPQLLTRVGVIEDGKPVSFERMTERLRQEILSLDASFDVNATTGRYELVVRGSGNNLEESKRALAWMKLALFHPDWRLENLPRIRDLVDQTLASLRNTTQGSEEGWVRGVAQAYLKQDNPLYLATSSFMTRAHNLHRLRWMLKAGGDDALYAFLADLGKTAGARPDRQALLASIKDGKYAGLRKLTAPQRSLALDAARDLETLLADLPDSSLAADWSYLCNQMAHDLRMGPQWALGMLQEVREAVLQAGAARLFFIGSSASQQALDAGLRDLIDGLGSGPVPKAEYRPGRRIDQRLKGRESGADRPVFVGLLNANSQGGVFLNSAPLASFHDTDRDKLLDYLASNLYAGGGAHTIFSKTIAAGLAYSNGLSAGLAAGRLQYYAERTPELPQTLQFVVGELKKAQPDASLTEYAIAGAFKGTRSAASYESRGEAQAGDLADGLTPEVVRRFHQAILDLRKTPDLAGELFRRMNAVYAKVLPGLGAPVGGVANGVYMVIGPEKQLASYEEYLKKADAPDARLWRLYPRDFWLLFR